MVGERHRRQRLHERLYVVDELLRTCYSREQQHVGLLFRRNLRRRAVKEGIELAIVQRGEVERLVGVELHGLRQHAVVDGVQRVGAFRYYNNVGAFFAVNGFAQPSRRQQLIVDNQPVIVDEQNVQSRLHIPVLIGIVEDYDIGVLGGLIVDDMFDAAASVGVDGNLNVGKFPFHLEWLVTDVAHGGVLVGEDETASLALVSPAQYGHFCLALEQSDEILHMRCLSRPADGDVADGNDGSRETPALQDIEFEELVSDAYAESVDAAQGPQPPVDFYVVAFHYIIMVMSLCVYCFFILSPICMVCSPG